MTIEDYCISLNPNNFFLVVLGVVDMCQLLLKGRGGSGEGKECIIYRGSPDSTVSLSTVPGLVRFANSTKYADSPV